MLMSYNIVTDPDDLLRKIPPNIMRDIESVMRRIEGLLPSLYMGLKTVLEKARPKRAKYYYELVVVERILRLFGDPGVSYLIGVPFQPVSIEDDDISVIPMAVPNIPIAVLGPTKCTVLVFPSAVVFPDIMLRSVLVHELVHCVVIDLLEWVTHKVEEMLGDLAPDLFLSTRFEPEHMLEPTMETITEYLKQNRVPVTIPETTDAVIDRIATDPEYADQILSRSVMIWLKPRASW